MTFAISLPAASSVDEMMQLSTFRTFTVGRIERLGEGMYVFYIGGALLSTQW